MTIDTMEQIIERLHYSYPNTSFFRIEIPGRESDIFIARKAPWDEYKKILGAVGSQADANELLLQLFLVYPKFDYVATIVFAANADFWTPGLIVELARCIQRGQGFTGSGKITNL